MPVNAPSFHDSHDGKDGELYLTGILDLDACGSQIRGCHVQRRPMYATPGGAPANLRWKARKSQPVSVFFASTCQIWLPFDFDFLPSSLNREM